MMETSTRISCFTFDATVQRRHEVNTVSLCGHHRFDILCVAAHRKILHQGYGHVSSNAPERLSQTLMKTNVTYRPLSDGYNAPSVATEPGGQKPEGMQRTSLATDLGRLVKKGQHEKVLDYFHQMQIEGVEPDKFSFVLVLKACARLRALTEGRQIHMQSINTGCELDVFVGTSLIDMYSKCGRIEDAQKLFDRMPVKDVVPWNTMILGYVKCGQGPKALELYQKMQLEQVDPDTFTFVGVLNACVSVRALEVGRGIHKDIIRSGCQSSVFVCNSLIDMYAKCGSIEEARAVFDKMQSRNVVSWTTMLTGYVKCELGHMALEIYRQMQLERVQADPATFIGVLKACARLRALEEGRRVHGQIIQSGCDSDLYVSSSLVYMYAKCGSIEDAEKVFKKMRTRSVVSWNVMIASFVKCGQCWKALELYRDMQMERMKPDAATFVVVLNALAGVRALEEGRLLHGKIIESGCESDPHVGSSLVDLYAKCGSIEEARALFDRMSTRNVVSWNVMIQGHMKCGQEQKALDLYKKMLLENLEPDAATFVGVLNACASLGALEEGRRVHSQIIQCCCESDMFVGSSLIDMYAKCGSIEDAQRLFNTMAERDVVCWNAMLVGYAMHGYVKEALELFQQMSKGGVEIDRVTYISLLSACSHVGLVEEGLHFFRSMSTVHGISATGVHYACMVDLLGRAGHLQQAEDMINSMSCEPDVAVWMTLLGACRVHGNVEIGERVAKKVIEMDPTNASAYVVLSNIYAGAEKWDSSENSQQMRVKREPGCAWIEVNNVLNSFIVDGQTHPQINEIHRELMNLFMGMKAKGYGLDSWFVSHDVEDAEEKVSHLQYHSEKVAIAFGLISTPPGSPLRIVKNMPICSDSHTAIKFITKITKRLIIVRDVNCFHHFQDGLCNCKFFC